MKKRKWSIIAVAAALVCVGVVWWTAADRIQWTVCRDNSDRGSAVILQSALNESKLENREHLPIIKIESVDQLRTFMDECGEFYDEPYANTPAFDEETSDMNEAYFKKYTVFLVRILATSGSYRYGVADVQVDGNSLCVYVEQINHPENGTADMEEWFAVVSISKDKVAGCIEYDAIIR